MAGIELSNGFSELNNPFDQAERFNDQAKARAAGEAETHFYDADYVTALEYGLPPTAGMGMGMRCMAIAIATYLASSASATMAAASGADADVPL